MTNEQIIIDGVDVSKCSYFNFTDEHYCNECSSEFGCAVCDERTNCCYKQLARKEQECEQEKALKETYLACYKAKHEDVEGKLFRYKRALADIKDIAEKDIAFCAKCNSDDKDCVACIEGGRALFAKDALKIISEVKNV